MLSVVHWYGPALAGEFGTATAVRGWCAALGEVGAEVSLVSDALVRPAVEVPPGVRHLAVAHRLAGRWRVPHDGDWLSDAELLVLHGGWTGSNVLVGAMARRRGVPYVVTAHGVYRREVLVRRALAKRAWAALFERRHLRRALGVHLFFDEEESHLRALAGEVPVIVCRPGFTGPEVSWKGPKGEYALWLGRFDRHVKGLDVLLLAIHGLPARDRPRVRLHGPDWRGKRREVAREVERLGLSRWITVGGPVYGPEKWALLERADAFLYPSRWEGCPMAVLEAAAVGLPLLVGPYPLGQFLAERGGAAVSEVEPHALGRGIGRVLGPEGPALGRRAAEVVRVEFAWSPLARRWIDAVAELRWRGEEARRP